MEEKLVLRIKPKKKVDRPYSADYEVYLNDWRIGKGVSGINLDMQAPERPKLTVDFYPDHIEIEDVDVEVIFKEQMKGRMSDNDDDGVIRTGALEATKILKRKDE